MCGRFVAPDIAAIERAWHLGRRNLGNPFEGIDPGPRFNVFPTTPILFLPPSDEPGKLDLGRARWGFIPHWWKSPRLPARTNHIARIEEASIKPMWRDAWRQSRCLIPAQGWYEWRDAGRSARASGKTAKAKQPYHLRRRDSKPFCFAGLMSSWTDPGSREEIVSCAMLTADAIGGFAGVHERMPVVLPDEAFSRWLSGGLADSRQVLDIVHKYATSGIFEHYKVGSAVNNPRNDGPELTEPLPD